MVSKSDYKKFLKKFNELLEYGNKKIKQSKVGTDTEEVRQNNLSLKSRATAIMMLVAHNYSESLQLLLKNPKTYDKSAAIIVRALFENYVNLRFIHISDTHLHLFLLLPDLQLKCFQEGFRKCLLNHPEWKNPEPESVFTDQKEWSQFINGLENEIRSKGKRNNIELPSRIPCLRVRIIEIDKTLKQHEREDCLEFEYVNSYPLLSNSVHLLELGIEDLEPIDIDSLTPSNFKIDSDRHDSLILLHAYSLYLRTLKVFLKHVNLFKENEYVRYASDLTKFQSLTLKAALKLK